jgi:integrase
MDHYWGQCRSCKALETLALGSIVIIYLILDVFPSFLKDRDFCPCPPNKWWQCNDISLTNHDSALQCQDTGSLFACGHCADTAIVGHGGHMGEKLTDKLIEKLRPPARGNQITYDSEVGGFGVRVTAAGAKSFILNYRTRSGRERRFTIGPAGEGGWKSGAARERAKDIKARIRSEAGYDPLGEIEAERDAPTVEQLCKRFLKEHAAKKRPATRDSYARSIDRHILPALKHRKVGEIVYADVDGLHRKVTEEAGPYAANRVVATLSKAFNLAIRWQWCTANPVRGVERNAEEKRKRYLSSDEVARLTEALGKHPDQQAANVVRMLLLTGARKGEVLSARWDQFDLVAGIWTKPSSETKQKRDHIVPISAPVRQLLADIRAAAQRRAEKKGRPLSPFVFPSRLGALRDVKEDWAALCRSANITTTKKTASGRTIVTHSARIHDLRHTHASVLASAGFSLPMIGALLGHSQPATTSRYSHLHLDAQRKAAETAASIIAPSGQGAEIVKHPKAS